MISGGDGLRTRASHCGCWDLSGSALGVLNGILGILYGVYMEVTWSLFLLGLQTRGVIAGCLRRGTGIRSCFLTHWEVHQGSLYGCGLRFKPPTLPREQLNGIHNWYPRLGSC